MIRELDKLHTLFAGFARRLELLGAKEKPKWDAITKALSSSERLEAGSYPMDSKARIGNTGQFVSLGNLRR